MELKVTMALPSGRLGIAENPFNGIESLNILRVEYLDANLLNPFNGIESTTLVNVISATSSANRIHSMELKAPGSHPGAVAALTPRIHSMELKVYYSLLSEDTMPVDQNPFNGIESYFMYQPVLFQDPYGIHSMELKVQNCLLSLQCRMAGESIQWN